MVCKLSNRFDHLFFLPVTCLQLNLEFLYSWHPAPSHFVFLFIPLFLPSYIIPSCMTPLLFSSCLPFFPSLNIHLFFCQLAQVSHCWQRDILPSQQKTSTPPPQHTHSPTTSNWPGNAICGAPPGTMGCIVSRCSAVALPRSVLTHHCCQIFHLCSVWFPYLSLFRCHFLMVGAKVFSQVVLPKLELCSKSMEMYLFTLRTFVLEKQVGA